MLLMNMNILCINESVAVEKQKAADGMASAVNKHLGTGGGLLLQKNWALSRLGI